MAKISSIIACVTLIAIGFWYEALIWVNEPLKYSVVSHWVWPLVFLLLLLATIAVACIILDEWRWKALLSVIVALIFVLFFGLGQLTLLGAVLIILFHAIAIWRIDREKKDHLKLHVGSMAAHGSTWLVLPLLLCLSFGYYLSPLIQDHPPRLEFPPTFREIVSVTVDRFAQAVEGNEVVLSEEIKNNALDHMIATLEHYAQPYQNYFPPFLAFWQFVILIGISFIFTHLAELIAMIIFKILLMTKFVAVETKMIEAESVSLHIHGT